MDRSRRARPISQSCGKPHPDASSGRSVPVAGGTPTLIGEGDEPAYRPRWEARRVCPRQTDVVRADRRRGSYSSNRRSTRVAPVGPTWSPDGRTLAFVSRRGDHSFIGLFTAGHPIRYSRRPRRGNPHRCGRWTATGSRSSASPGPAARRDHPCPTARDVGRSASRTSRPSETIPNVNPTAEGSWTSGDPIDTILQNPDGIGLRWAADETLVFLSYRDGWPHRLRAPPRNEPTRPLLHPGSLHGRAIGAHARPSRHDLQPPTQAPIAATSSVDICSRCRSVRPRRWR